MQEPDLNELHKEMRKLTLEAGVGVKSYDRLAQGKLEGTKLRNLDFLMEVYAAEYAEVYRVYNLPTMTEEIWDRYLTMFDDVTFPEVKLLKKARRQLRGRYTAFFKSKKKKTGIKYTGKPL